MHLVSLAVASVAEMRARGPGTDQAARDGLTRPASGGFQLPPPEPCTAGPRAGHGARTEDEPWSSAVNLDQHALFGVSLRVLGVPAPIFQSC